MQLASFFLRGLPHHGILVVGELWQNLPVLAVGPPQAGASLLAPVLSAEGGGRMVTYEELFEYTLVILSTISLVIQILKKK